MTSGARASVIFDGMSHHSPYFEALVGCDQNWIERFVGRNEPYGSRCEVDALEGEIAFKAAYGQIAVVGFD